MRGSAIEKRGGRGRRVGCLYRRLEIQAGGDFNLTRREEEAAVVGTGGHPVGVVGGIRECPVPDRLLLFPTTCRLAFQSVDVLVVGDVEDSCT